MLAAEDSHESGIFAPPSGSACLAGSALISKPVKRAASQYYEVSVFDAEGCAVE